MSARWRTAWVTGAGTGIGRALALRLARQGVSVAISGRSADKLAEVVAAAPTILAVPLDVTSRDEVVAGHHSIVEALGPVELAVLNAGVWHPMKATTYDAGQAIHSMQVNYFGIVNALEPLIPAMLDNGKGQIALVASVAGYRGLPRAAAYAPSKAAVINLAEVLRLELSRRDIVISLVNPGFVETPMTAVNDFPMPYLLKADDAAERILRGLEAGRFEIAFPWQLVMLLKLLRLLPNGLYLRIAGRLSVD